MRGRRRRPHYAPALTVTGAPRRRPAGITLAPPANRHPRPQNLTYPHSSVGESSRPCPESGAPYPSLPITAGGVSSTDCLGQGQGGEQNLGKWDRTRTSRQ
jgi:hypothetical protein